MEFEPGSPGHKLKIDLEDAIHADLLDESTLKQEKDLLAKLKEMVEKNFDNVSGTYDYDGIAEDLLAILEENK